MTLVLLGRRGTRLVRFFGSFVQRGEELCSRLGLVWLIFLRFLDEFWLFMVSFGLWFVEW